MSSPMQGSTVKAQRTPHPSRRTWVDIAILLLVAAALLFPGLGEPVVNREQELRVVLSARNMVEHGHWLMPDYLGEPRLRKPPLMYWLVALAFKAADTVSSALVARLPSAIATMVFAITFYLGAARWIGRRRAFLSSLVLLSSFIMLKQGRLAETDLLLAFFTTTAVLAGLRAMQSAQQTGAWLVAGAAAGLGFMTKGPAALAIPVLTWAAGAIAMKTSCRRPTLREVLPGIALLLAIALPWYVWLLTSPAAREVAEAQLESEIARTVSGSHHPGPIYYYVYTLLHAMLPWSILLPGALIPVYLQAKRRASARMLAVVFSIAFVALSVTGSKQLHYCTLLVPPAALAVGWFLGHRGLSSALQRYREGTLLVILAILAAGAIALAIMVAKSHGGLSVMDIATATAGLALAAAGLRLKATRHRVIALTLSLGSLLALYTDRLEARDERYSVIPTVLEANRDIISNAPRLHQVGRNRAMLEFYTGRHLVVHDSLEKAWGAAKPGDVVFASEFVKNEALLGVEPAAAIAEGEHRGVFIALYCKAAAP